ncbi:MAG: hypothetical protein ACK484_03135 [Sphingobacteriales bacterium]|jgi:hypothetical protein
MGYTTSKTQVRKVLTTNWHWSRVFRAVTGVAALVFAIVSRDTVLGLGGAMLLIMGLSNTGCGGGSCKR